MNALAAQAQPMAEAIEQVLITGDLKALSSAQRVDYYNRVCNSVGLNPLTKPFEYITLNGKLTLYAKRDATDQLRAIHGISLGKPHIEYTDDMVMVTVEASDRVGRTDCDLGAVNIKILQGEARANAIMKAITKAKRRVTLSLAGLGWLDESEVDSVPSAQRVVVDTTTGEIVENPFDDDAPSEKGVKVQLASQAQLNEMHTLGIQFHGGKAEWDAAIAKWMEAASKGAISTVSHLSDKECDWIVESLTKRIANKRMAEATTTPK